MFLDLSWELIHGDQPLLTPLSDRELEEFGLLLFRLFPADKYPEREPDGEVHEVSGQDRIAQLRRTVLGILAARSTLTSIKSILRIANNSPPSVRIWIKWQYNEAIRSCAALLVPTRTPPEVIALVRSTKAALVDSADDLVAVVLNSLDRLQAKLRTKATEWRALWNEDGRKKAVDRKNASGLSPKNEDALSDVVANWLTEDIGVDGQIVFNREVKIRLLEFTDIRIDSFTKGKADRISIIVETKRCTHSQIKVAAKTQLVDRYLIPLGLGQGIYLVGWYRGKWQPHKSATSWRPSSLDQARKDLSDWAANASNEKAHIFSFLLDCS